MKASALLLAVPMVMLMSVSLAADDYPDLKPGLWSSKETISSMKSIPEMSGQMCTNKAVFDSYRNVSKDPDRPCKTISQNHIGSTYSAETECNFGGRIDHSSSKLVATGDTGMHMEMKMGDGTLTTIDMQYIGACPAGMVPGDFVTSNGMKINVLTGTSAKAAH